MLPGQRRGQKPIEKGARGLNPFGRGRLTTRASHVRMAADGVAHHRPFQVLARLSGGKISPGATDRRGV